MDASDIVRLLYTTHYSPADLEEVNKICKTFPEFSTAQLLRVRIMEVLGREKQQQLKIAAVYSMSRQKLYQLVNEVKPLPEPEEEEEEKEVIQFSEEPHEEADVIIRQHAPYAGEEPEPDPELLELDEQPGEELLNLDEDTEEAESESGEEEEISPASLLYDLEKDESDMEEPKVDEEEIPAIDQVDDLEESKVNEEEIPAIDQVDDLEESKADEEEIPAIDQVDDLQEDPDHHLIRRFIKEDPGPIRADRQTSLKGDVSLDSIREHDGFITDTLAQIYVKQGLYAKAIYAYERLSLKYPEKSAYFAAQIEKIRNINHS